MVSLLDQQSARPTPTAGCSAEHLRHAFLESRDRRFPIREPSAALVKTNEAGARFFPLVFDVRHEAVITAMSVVALPERERGHLHLVEDVNQLHGRARE
jgi:hypothetical protein